MRAIKLLTDLQLLAFTVLAVVSFVQWYRRRSKAAWWVVVAFGSLAAVLLTAQVLPDGLSPDTLVVVGKLLLTIGLLFPYFLSRFMAELSEPHPWLRQIGPALTGVVIAGSLALPRPGLPQPSWYQLYVAALVAQWTFLCGTLSWGLWKAAAHEPAIARQRMRTLACGSAGLALIIVIAAVTGPTDRVSVDITLQLLALAAVAMFYLGFAPPALLRLAWRQRQDGDLREAVTRLMTARTAEEVAATLIPTIPGLVGGQAAALVDERGQVIGSFGLGLDQRSELALLAAMEADLHDGELRKGLFSLNLRSATLLVWASPFTPYFGTEDIDFLRYLADLADLALQRCEVYARERCFIANASHELRTPLTTISGMSGLLHDTWKTLPEPVIDECLGALNRQGQRVRDLVQNLLDLSRVENERRQPLRAVSLAAAGRNALEGAPPPAGRVVDLVIREDLVAMADPLGLERALTNLLVNAYRYGGPAVRVEAVGSEREVLLTVSDNGAGVPEDLVPRLFDPFTRGGSTGGIAGSGLGLAITQRLVETFGGRIGYEPGQPSGARFCVHLRRAA